jgi:tyrosyl-tRNA synthetase
VNAWDVLKERGFVEQVSDEEGLRAALERPLTFYIGYDPTATSLHTGHLLTAMAVTHLQRAGHRPIIIIGGGTGMIGDPTGRTEMRQMLTVEKIDENLQAIKVQMSRFIPFGKGQALALNNADWLMQLAYIPFLRDIGQHFSVNRMLAAEAYRQRLERGLSFIELNYQILQAYDYLHLYREHGCTLQLGGNDQWGNILAGVDLIRRVEGAEVYAMTFPLLTTASGAKMGKTAAGTVWIDADMTPPFDYYQYWINVEDGDVARFMRLFTFMPLEEIDALTRFEGAELRPAKEVLAYEATRVAHGQQAADEAREASRALFAGGGDADAVPAIEVEQGELASGIAAVDLFERTGLCRSRSEARRLIQQGGAYVNDVAVDDVDREVTPNDLQDGALLLRAGKKRYHRVVVV